MASDCREVVEEISSGGASIYGEVIQEIKSHVLSFNSCKILHEFRSSNYDAHNLAKYALGLGPGHHIWLCQPGGIPFVHVNIVTDE